ncbi:MAG: putative bifunctional diguanylate cyclase/phosphodiesterase [Actinomycetota bacterium]
MSEAAANLLLVDDRPENLLALEAVLEPLGQNLVTANSGKEALKYLLTEDFALILMDVEMPEVDGFETAAVIKQRERSRHIPIIFVTAASSHADQIFRGYKAGAVDYLLKPYDPTVLRSKVEVFIDLYNLRRQAEQLAYRAVHDPLTGLPNRVLFTDRLKMAVANVGRRSSVVSVIFFDLDGFKLVNDTMGHTAGDQLLEMLADRVRAVVRPADTVARLGGDEFIVLAEVADELDAINVADRIATAIATPFALDAGAAFVSASVGIAVGEGPDDDAEALIREADIAMYRAKQQGGGRHEIYDRAMRRRAVKQVHCENALHHALEQGEFRLVYQPVVAIASGTMVGVEALLRWEHPQLGMTAPADFLVLAEETSLIVPIGAWALKEALRQGERWRSARPDAAPLGLTLNVSIRQLWQPEFLRDVSEALEATGTDPELLTLDLSEAAFAGDGRSATSALSGLRALGVAIALDDFGSGQSSLVKLKRCPVDSLKIDPSFIEPLGAGDEHSDLVRAIVDLAHALGCTVVAESVETATQLAELSALGCDLAQGLHLGGPMPGGQLVETLLEGATDGTLA